MKVALVTDWMSNVGGGGRVLTHLHALFPDAPVYTSIVDRERLPEHMVGWDIRPSFLQRLPFARRRYQAFLPLMPLAFEEFDLREFDLVISCSSACAKGVIVAPGAVHICYCYTPCRYLWDLYHEYMEGFPLRSVAAPIAHWLRMWDRSSSDRVDRFVAISHEVAGRIRRHYGRDSELIYPPVDVERFTPTDRPPEEVYLVLSRLVRYKRVDLAVEAAGALGRRLIVVGDGPERKRLQKMAGPTVELVGALSDARVADLLARCKALIFPGYEDFGITPVEAQAAGRPVIAFGRGGATETVHDGRTGILFDDQNVGSLVAAIERFEQISFDPAVCRQNAERFAPEEFRSRMLASIDGQVLQASRQAAESKRYRGIRESA